MLEKETEKTSDKGINSTEYPECDEDVNQMDCVKDCECGYEGIEAFDENLIEVVSAQMEADSEMCMEFVNKLEIEMNDFDVEERQIYNFYEEEKLKLDYEEYRRILLLQETDTPEGYQERNSQEQRVDIEDPDETTSQELSRVERLKAKCKLDHLTTEEERKFVLELITKTNFS